MAKPRRTAMITKLQQLTREYFEDESHTPLDFAVAWTERGRTLTALAAHITQLINGGPEIKAGQFEVTRNMVSTYLDEIGGEGAASKLVAARRNGAHGMVEEGLQELDTSSDDRDAINANVRRMEGRERLAAIWNKEFAKAGNQTNVMLTFGQQHLDALRRRVVTATATISEPAEDAQPVDVTSEPERE